MKRLLILIPFVLSGCLATAPVERHFPEVPPELVEACPDLQKTKNTNKLSDVITTISANYSQYHECRNKVDLWIEWYNQQKKIFEEVK